MVWSKRLSEDEVPSKKPQLKGDFIRGSYGGFSAGSLRVLGGFSEGSRQVLGRISARSRLDFASAGDLGGKIDALIAADPDSELRKKWTWLGSKATVARDVCAGLIYLHTNHKLPVIHRDIKPGAFLYVSPGKSIQFANFTNPNPKTTSC